MTGPEVKNPTHTTPVRRAGTENFAAGEPGNEDELFGLRNVEMLAVHFFGLERDFFAQPSGDRMSGRNHPEVFAVVRFAPFQVAGGAHQFFEDFREMPGVQHHQTHARHDSSMNTFNDFV